MPGLTVGGLNINHTAFSPLSEHAPLWERIQLAREHQRMPQALLLMGSPHVGLYDFAHRLAAILLCHAESKPCSECDSCYLLHAGTHPDYRIIRPEIEGGVIKIEQIRNLQEDVYQTPQCGQRMVVLIEHADKLNTASANALLKVLEEPPSYLHFILSAEQLNAIPATILSRTQRLMFPDPYHDISNDVGLGEYYPSESPRAKLYAQRESIMTALCELIEGQRSPCTVATQWADFPLPDVLWLLYLILAQAMRMQLLQAELETAHHEAINRLSCLLTPLAILHHVDTMYQISKKLSHNISINTTLTLEDLLIGFIPKGA